jgi:hypothetical protein
MRDLSALVIDSRQVMRVRRLDPDADALHGVLHDPTLQLVDSEVAPSNEMLRGELGEALLTLWDKAGTQSYDKREWKRFVSLLARAGVEL